MAVAERWIGTLAGCAASECWIGAAVSERWIGLPTGVAIPDGRAGSMSDMASRAGPASSVRIGSLMDVACTDKSVAEGRTGSMVAVDMAAEPVADSIEPPADVEPAVWVAASGDAPAVGAERAADER